MFNLIAICSPRSGAAETLLYVRKHLPAGDRQAQLLKLIADQWSALLSPYDQWFLRLKAIYYVPLDDEEITILADYSGQSPEKIRRLATSIHRRLEDKDNEYEKSREQAVILMTIQGRLLSKLRRDLKQGILGREEVERREGEIAATVARKNEKIRKGNLPVAPSTREILLLLDPRAAAGEAGERRLNTRLSRARRRLSATLKLIPD